ncbi:hypothetical protein N9L92_00375 [Saprospiraceae bacterium]|nr:hypothetical protein [Saprospiraceae bacterium]
MNPTQNDLPDKYEGRTHSTKRPDQNVRSSSKEAFSKSDFSSDAMELFDFMKGYGKPMTRLMIEEYTRFKSYQYTQHVSTLIAKGLLLESKKKAPCPISKRKKFWLKVAPKKATQTQLPL